MTNVLEHAENAAPEPLCFRLAPIGSVWELTEKTGGVGGVFATIGAALAFARNEARAAPGSRLVIEFTEAPPSAA
jgi:hypothetical protein